MCYSGIKYNTDLLTELRQRVKEDIMDIARYNSVQ